MSTPALRRQYLNERLAQPQQALPQRNVLSEGILHAVVMHIVRRIYVNNDVRIRHVVGQYLIIPRGYAALGIRPSQCDRVELDEVVPPQEMREEGRDAAQPGAVPTGVLLRLSRSGLM